LQRGEDKPKNATDEPNGGVEKITEAEMPRGTLRLAVTNLLAITPAQVEYCDI